MNKRSFAFELGDFDVRMKYIKRHVNVATTTVPLPDL